ncbi:MAG: sugar transferase [Verrucomicrobiota bacterium]|nr:sugar transferase [Verrucomicrobiota bacterium]
MTKRLFDIAFSSLVLTLGSPFFLLLALSIKLSSPGPIFYSCSRIGRNNTPFTCYKFRTMYADAETKLQLLLSSDVRLLQEWKTYFKLRQDPRITPLGKWLRKTSLDELPQFFNVFRGDMSVVGPRPLTQTEITDYLKENAPKLLSVRPGLTSLWAIRGRNHLTLEQRISLELHYVDNQNFLLDCRLILQTALHVFFPKGAC